MENGEIPDGNITASSERFYTHHAFHGRLNFKAKGITRGAWTARNRSAEQWLQVDLDSQFTRITGVATQGREDRDNWVKEYKLGYSNKTPQFQDYKGKGQNIVKVRHY